MIIVSKFPGKCNACGLAVKVGDKVDWRRNIRGVSHEACFQNPEAVRQEAQPVQTRGHLSARESVNEDLAQKNLIAERERLQEQAAFLSDPDMRDHLDPPSEPPPPQALTFEEYVRGLVVPF
jgi:hypothetical protein